MHLAFSPLKVLKRNIKTPNSCFVRRRCLLANCYNLNGAAIAITMTTMRFQAGTSTVSKGTTHTHNIASMRTYLINLSTQKN